jgi:hypothetical protein
MAEGRASCSLGLHPARVKINRIAQKMSTGHLFFTSNIIVYVKRLYQFFILRGILNYPCFSKLKANSNVLFCLPYITDHHTLLNLRYIPLYSEQVQLNPWYIPILMVMLVIYFGTLFDASDGREGNAR